jgi:hypothetical protein
LRNQVPFNNQCSATNNVSTNINFIGLVPELSKSPTQHVKATLPPSVYFPGEAEIRYYVKVTVNRPSLLKENPRAVRTPHHQTYQRPYGSPEIVCSIQLRSNRAPKAF